MQRGKEQAFPEEGASEIPAAGLKDFTRFIFESAPDFSDIKTFDTATIKIPIKTTDRIGMRAAR
jgi:hypothetical protein